MKNSRALLATLLLWAAGLLLMSLAGDPNSITPKQVALKTPKGFPPPVYRFKDNPLSPAGFVLGRALFYDPLLSRDSTISCATCHQAFAAFAHIDHPLSHGIEGRIGTRNVPPLQNLMWSNHFMWDGGVNHLEIQPLNPLTHPDEMNETLPRLLAKLQQSPRYPALFAAAYGDTAIRTERVLKALAQFTGLLISANAKYDQYLRHEVKLSQQEQQGLRLFEQKCSSCHPAPLFTTRGFASNGLPPDSLLRDTGRQKISGRPEDLYQFSIPSLRNVEVTYPYMHDGRMARLWQVLGHYSRLATDTTLTDARLRAIGPLSANEQVDLLAFLRTLTDRSFLTDKRFVVYP